MSNEFLDYLEDILDAMDKAEILLEGVSYQQFEDDFRINKFLKIMMAKISSPYPKIDILLVPDLSPFSRGLLAFQKSPLPGETPDSEVRVEDEAPDFSRIRCPLCAWQPQASSRWYCASHGGAPEYFSGGCGTVWNTFTTGGLCPGCGHQWRWTACLRCTGWSLHEAWYVTE